MASPRKFLVLAKIETTQFTDAVPTGAANSILVKNLTVTPLKVESEDRALIRSYFGNSEMLPVSEEAMIEFDVEMAGSGTAATPAKYGPLLRACGFAETIAADVSYNPVSSAFEFVTIYCYRDGVLYKLLGAHGNVSIAMAAKKIPHYHFSFIGKYTAVTDAAIPGTADFSGFKTPVASIPTWTGTLTLDGYAAKVSAFNADMAVEVSHALWMNNETLAPIDRKPKGSITVEAVTIATKDYFTLVRNATLSVFTLTHGTSAGYKVKLDAPKVQLVDVAEADFSGTLAYTFNLTFNPNAGNDEFKITTL
jgi:hypothetical protein